MDNNSLIDFGAAAGLFLFTGAEVGIDNSIFEIISKFGVVAVLWFWLRDMKIQLKDQLTIFTSENEKLRVDHQNNLKELSEIHKDFRDRMEKQITVKDEQIRTLQDKLKD